MLCVKRAVSPALGHSCGLFAYTAHPGVTERAEPPVPPLPPPKRFLYGSYAAWIGM